MSNNLVGLRSSLNDRFIGVLFGDVAGARRFPPVTMVEFIGIFDKRLLRKLSSGFLLGDENDGSVFSSGFKERLFCPNIDFCVFC